MDISPDDDLVTVRCKSLNCTHEFEMPWDAMMFASVSDFQCMACGKCGENNGFDCVKDPIKEDAFKSRCIKSGRRVGKNYTMNLAKETLLKPFEEIMLKLPDFSGFGLLYLHDIEATQDNPRDDLLRAIYRELKRRDLKE